MATKLSESIVSPATADRIRRGLKKFAASHCVSSWGVIVNVLVIRRRSPDDMPPGLWVTVQTADAVIWVGRHSPANLKAAKRLVDELRLPWLVVPKRK